MIRKTLILIATISILALRNANAEFVKSLEPTPSQKRTNEKLEQIVLELGRRYVNFFCKVPTGGEAGIYCIIEPKMTYLNLPDSGLSQIQCVVSNASLADYSFKKSWKVLCVDMAKGEEVKPFGNLLKIAQDLNDGLY